MGEFKGIELFAGAGGLALGLERAGIDGAAFVERDHRACETLRKNRPGWNVLEGDIREVDFTAWRGEVDLVSGGAPCQAFSHAGKRLGFGDVRGTLFAEFARCVDETAPAMFLFENVKGLLTHDCGRTFATIINKFESLGYEVAWKVLNACRYGVGQKRERVIVIGVRADVAKVAAFRYPVEDARVTTLSDALRDVPDSPYVPYSERKRAVLDLVPAGGCWVDLPDDVARDYMGKSYFSGGGRRGAARRLSWGAPCPTITTSPSQKLTDCCHPDYTRPLTIREYARVQSFPDDWEFVGTLSDEYRLIGNAVPVELARRVGLEVVAALERIRVARHGD